jgi:hypothetical protein
MKGAWPKFFFFPAAGIALVLAAIFFKVYGPMSRPDVPRPIEMAVAHYVPGVAIGRSVAASSKYLTKLTYAQHVGFIGAPLGITEVKQVRLLLGARDRSLGAAPDTSRVDAVEIVAIRGASRPDAMLQMSNLFHTSAKFGCIVPSREGAEYREVQYWTTKNDLGGAALIVNWHTKAEPPKTDSTRAAILRAYEMQAEGFHVDVPTYTYGPPPPVVWSMLFWSGPFRANYTLRADFQAKSCSEVAPK